VRWRPDAQQGRPHHQLSPFFLIMMKQTRKTLAAKAKRRLGKVGRPEACRSSPTMICQPGVNRPAVEWQPSTVLVPDLPESPPLRAR
jgi:hypothetical protein